MKILTKDQILEAKDLKTKIVPVSEWGGDVCVSEMPADARIEWETDVFDNDSQPILDNWKAKLVVRCLVDEHGECLFSVDELTALGKKSPKAINKVYRVAIEINGIGDDSVENTEKN